MKYNHENLEIIESWLAQTEKDIIFSDDFVREVYHSALSPLYPKLNSVESVKVRQRGFSLQYDFVRRDLLKISHKKSGGSAENIKCGYVYAITNPAWNDYVKIGSTIDVNDRLNTYQTCSPLRDFKVIDYYFVWDRREEEEYLHSLFTDRNNEWCKISLNDLMKLFKQRKKNRIILPSNDILFEVKDIVNTKLNMKKQNWYSILNVEYDDQ